VFPADPGDKRQDGLGRRASAAAHPDGQNRRPQVEPVRRRRPQPPIDDHQRGAGRGRLGRGQPFEKTGLGRIGYGEKPQGIEYGHRTAAGQDGVDPFGRVPVFHGQSQLPGQDFHGRGAGRVGGRGHHGRGPDGLGHGPGQGIGAAQMPGKEAHHEPAGIVHRQDGRVHRLVPKVRGDDPHGDAAGGHEDVGPEAAEGAGHQFSQRGIGFGRKSAGQPLGDEQDGVQAFGETSAQVGALGGDGVDGRGLRGHDGPA